MLHRKACSPSMQRRLAHRSLLLNSGLRWKSTLQATRLNHVRGRPARLPECVVAVQINSFCQQRRFSGISGGPLERYLAMKAANEITPDPKQEVCMKMLDDLAKKIEHYTPTYSPRAKAAPVAAPAQSSGGFLGGFFGGGAPAKKAPVKKVEPPKLVPVGPRGLYLWGGTGTGKTFMMDIFHDNISVKKKKRIHFHEWMIDVHERLHRRQKGSSANTNSSADDLVEQVAQEMLDQAWLLCFDEFQVTHISDAIILKRIFEVLFERGAIVVATSNRPPEDLYLNGLNRALFLPFIPMLKDFCHVHPIGADVDYRMISQEDDDDRIYMFPNGIDEQKIFERKFYKICQGEVNTGIQLETQGRRVLIPKAATYSSVAWFNFSDLCDKALGAADYLAIGSTFHTVFIANIPKLTLSERDQVRRFITCIDAFYEKHIKLFCCAEHDPITLFQVSDADRATSVADEIFAWDRTVSRLMEMQSVKYLSDAVRDLDADQFMNQYRIKSLSDEDIKEFWRRYDADDSGTMDMKEFRIFLEDLTEKAKGHRHVSDDVFQACRDSVDTDKDGLISFEEFEEFLSDYTLIKSTVNLGSI